MSDKCPCYAHGFIQLEHATLSTAFADVLKIANSFQNYESMPYVYEAPSGVVSEHQGCYTNRSFRKGDLITVCEDGILLPARVLQPVQCSRFSWACDDLSYCMRLSTHPSRVLRNSSLESKESNVELDWLLFQGIPCLIATADIAAGVELLAPYTYGASTDQVTALRIALKDEDVVDGGDFDTQMALRTWKHALGYLSREMRAKIKANLVMVGTF
jgi:hypothetical protein